MVVSRERWRFGEIARKPKAEGVDGKSPPTGITSAAPFWRSSEDESVNQSAGANRERRRQNRNGGSRESRRAGDFHGIEQATSEGLFRGVRTHDTRSCSMGGGWEVGAR